MTDEPKSETILPTASDSGKEEGRPSTTEEFPCQVKPKGGSVFNRVLLLNFCPGSNCRFYYFSDTGCDNLFIERVDFSYSVFERAYFRKVRFSKCSFIGAKFKESAFPGCEFEECDFSYSTFHEASIFWHQVGNTLPSFPNVRRDLLQNLRANSLSVGDAESQNHFIDMEIKAQQEYFRRAINRDEIYYKQKYDTLGKRIRLRLWSVTHRISSFLWGNGEHIWRMMFSTALILVLLPLISSLFSASRETTLDDLLRIFALHLRETVQLFLDLPDAGKSLHSLYASIVIILRYLILGLAISLLFRRISVR